MIETSIICNDGGESQKVALTAGTSAQSTVIDTDEVYVLPTVLCFMRQGANPVAVVDSDIALVANAPVRVSITRGSKLAFISANAGAVYLTPGG